MSQRWRLTIVIYCCIATGGTVRLDIPNISLTDTCPEKHRIKDKESQDMMIQFIKDDDACKIIKESRGNGKRQRTTPNLHPRIQPEFGNEHVLNITWDSSVLRATKRRKYLLQLTKYVKDGVGYKTSTACIRVKVTAKWRKFKERLTLFFDCIQLVPEEDVHIGVKLWHFTRRQAVQSACITRHKRSLPVSKSCERALGEIQCSEEQTKPLSYNSYIPRICRCSAPPRLSMERLENNSFSVMVWNIAQYTIDTELKIYNNVDHQLVYNHSLGMINDLYENITIVTDRKLGPGNYTLEVYTTCPRDDNAAHSHDCLHMDQVKLNYTVEVPYPAVSFKENPWIYLGAVAGTITGVSLTILLCVVLHWRGNPSKKKKDQSMNMHLRIPNSDSHHEASSLLAGMNGWLNNDVTTSDSQKTPHDTKPYETNTRADLQDVVEPHLLKMLLAHPDTPIHERAIREFSQILQDKFGIHLVESAVNWRDFAESAASSFKEIVIIMSPGLLNICKAYKEHNFNRERFESMLKVRKYEYIPCIVLQKLQYFIEDNPNDLSVAIHLVSFSRDIDSMDIFLDEFDFLKRYRCCYLYKLCLNDDASESLQLNKDKLMQMIIRLKGNGEQDILHLTTNSSVSHAAAGRSLSKMAF